VSRSSKSRRQPRSSQLGFYQADWADILTSAKAFFRLHIYTVDPFPERCNNKDFEEAHKCLLDAFDNYMCENENATYDEGGCRFPVLFPADNVVGVYQSHKIGMITLVSRFMPVKGFTNCLQVFEEGSTTRGCMKAIGREVVKVHYKDQILPTLDYDHNSEDLRKVVQENVFNMIDDSTFHMGLTLDARVSVLIKPL
jgi:hypothetical protein